MGRWLPTHHRVHDDGDFAGWRTWDGINGTRTKFGMTVSGQAITTNVSGDSVSFGSVILNQFNPALPGQDYATHWNTFATGTLANFAGSKQDCVDGGQAAYGFKNQDQGNVSLVAGDGAAG